MVIQLDDLRLIVQRSAQDIDQNIPSWHNKIDLSTLNMGDSNYCICGQLQSPLYSGMAMRVDKGFYLNFAEIVDGEEVYRNRIPDEDSEYGVMPPNYRVLTALWRKEIESRLESRLAI